MSEHIYHNSSLYPVEGCKECDKEIGRPILLGFGDGLSNRVMPRKRTQ